MNIPPYYLNRIEKAKLIEHYNKEWKKKKRKRRIAKKSRQINRRKR